MPRNSASCPNCGGESHEEPCLCDSCSEELDQIEQHHHKEIKDLREELAAWRFRYPDLTYTNKIDGIQPKR